MKNKDRLALIDNLNKSEALSNVEKRKLSKAISSEDKVIGYSVDFSEISPVEIIRSFNELVEIVVKLLNKAEDKVYFASRYTNTNVIGPILKVFKRGVKLFVIDGDSTNLSQKMGIGNHIVLLEGRTDMHNILPAFDVAIWQKEQ